MMEVFAGFGAHTDYEMGRVLDAVAKRFPMPTTRSSFTSWATTVPRPKAVSTA
jgi:hypothetical protein